MKWKESKMVKRKGKRIKGLKGVSDKRKKGGTAFV